MLPPLRTDLRKCSCPGIPPQESSVTVDGTFDLPTTEMRVGGNGNDGSLPEYASVTLTMKYWLPALSVGRSNHRPDRIGIRSSSPRGRGESERCRHQHDEDEREDCWDAPHLGCVSFLVAATSYARVHVGYSRVGRF